MALGLVVAARVMPPAIDAPCPDAEPVAGERRRHQGRDEDQVEHG